MPKVFGTLIMGSMGLHIAHFSHYLLRLWLFQSLLFLVYTCTFLSHKHREKGREQKTRNEGESVDERKKSNQRKKPLHKCSLGLLVGLGSLPFNDFATHPSNSNKMVCLFSCFLTIIVDLSNILGPWNLTIIQILWLFMFPF